jgi:hypothetical protein
MDTVAGERRGEGIQYLDGTNSGDCDVMLLACRLSRSRRRSQVGQSASAFRYWFVRPDSLGRARSASWLGLLGDSLLGALRQSLLGILGFRSGNVAGDFAVKADTRCAFRDAMKITVVAGVNRQRKADLLGCGTGQCGQHLVMDADFQRLAAADRKTVWK